MIKKMSMPLKIILSIIFPVFMLIWIIGAAKEMSATIKNAEENPCEETVSKLIDAWSRIILSVNNHPDTWKQLRGIWYKINGSPKVPTYLKKELLKVFKKKGLHISNEKIIDNFRVNIK